MTKVSRRAVADSIRADIKAGRWRPGEQVPSTREIASEYDIAVRTATEALGILVTEGWLTARNGVGRYVSESQGTSDH